jgi:hypothetical protein
VDSLGREGRELENGMNGQVDEQAGREESRKIWTLVLMDCPRMIYSLSSGLAIASTKARTVDQGFIRDA